MADGNAYVGNAADKRQVTRGAKRAELLRQQELADLQVVLELPAARRLLWRILIETRIKDTTFDRDPMVLAARVGRREHGLWLQAELERAAPAIMATLYAEAAQRRLEDGLFGLSKPASDARDAE